MRVSLGCLGTSAQEQGEGRRSGTEGTPAGPGFPGLGVTQLYSEGWAGSVICQDTSAGNQRPRQQEEDRMCAA